MSTIQSTRYIRLLVGIFLVTFILAGTAGAHSFTVLLVAPESATDRDTYDGFRLATKERDSHANEESDGHLGGLDVYILVPERRSGESQNLSTFAPDLVAVTGNQRFDPELAEGVGNPDAVLVHIPAVTTKLESLFLQADKDSGLRSFAVRFADEFGRKATEAAVLGYITARIIDIAVRPQESVADTKALRDIISNY